MDKARDPSQIPADQAAQMGHRFKMILETSLDGFCVIRLDGTLLEANTSLCRMLGYEQDELIGRKLKDFDSVLSEQEITHIIQNVMKQGYARFTTQNRRKDGTIIDVEVSVQYYNHEDEQFLFSFSRDITQLKKASQELEKSERMYKTLFEGTAEGILIGDIETRYFRYANPAFCQMLGYTEAEITRMRPEDIHPLPIANQAIAKFEKMAPDGKTFASNIPCLRKDGTVLYANINGTKVIIEDRECAIGFFTDITDSKKAQDELMASEARFRALSNSAFEGIVIHDQFKVLDANQKYLEMFGYTLDEIKTMDGLATIDPDYHEIVKGRVQSGYHDPYELMCVRKDGSKFPVEIQAAKIDYEGRTVRVATIRDVSQQKAIEAERKHYHDKLMKAQRHAYISSMGEIVAHQVNQPLTRINILLDRAIEQCEAQPCPHDALKDIQESLTEAQEAASIIRRYRQCLDDMSLAETHLVDIHSIANKIVSILSEKTRQSHMLIRLTELDRLPSIQMNETALEQLLLQLIINGIEAADGQRQHTLNLSGRQIDDRIELEFSDDCCGIAEEHLDKIFDPFFSTKTKDRGLGLGLDIVQKTLLNYGGHIRVESKVGEGTTFYVTLPADNS